jgi:1,4-alpha-glucan branching enzyme
MNQPAKRVVPVIGSNLRPEAASDRAEITEQDVYLFRAGRHSRLYEVLGAQPVADGEVQGTRFAVWAPNARAVSVIGGFNGWRADAHVLHRRDDGSGIWEGFLPGVGHGEPYKYHVDSGRGFTADRGDPFARYWEVPPNTASRVWRLDYAWGDAAWVDARARHNAPSAPMAVYELHLGSWRRMVEAHGERYLGYREAADRLADYVADLGFTHVELMPVMEHPFYGSWGYQIVGYFAPTARYGAPEDFMYLVDRLHQRGIGVILDWVPSHFPDDAHGLSYYDGTYLFEHGDRRRGYHPEWNSYIFDYGRPEVRSFLLSSAAFWLDRYHADGLRVDAVASMLYLDYGRRDGEWLPNEHGGNENLDAIGFLREFNTEVQRGFPDTRCIAEESTAWPKVSQPVADGGLGFDMKWNMGWMHDTLQYLGREPVHRSYHQQQLTFSIWYAFAERFMLPLSHDEVVYGKGSLYGRMPGDDWQKRANLRLLLGFMYAHPGKKLLFMGGEFGQHNEWQHDHSLDWHLLEQDGPRGVQQWVRDLNRLYRAAPSLHERDFEPEGFEWMDYHDAGQSVIAFVRHGREPGDMLLAVCNFTPVPRHNYRVGVPRGGRWEEVLNSDAWIYGGSGQGNLGGIEADPVAVRDQFHSLVLTLPPLAIVFLDHHGEAWEAAR